jgi:hypothetical protein
MPPSSQYPPDERPAASTDDYGELYDQEEEGYSGVILSLSYKHPWLSGAFYNRSLNQLFLIQPQLSIHSPPSQIIPLCKQSNLSSIINFYICPI